jgi:LacI family transcriptional regulator
MSSHFFMEVLRGIQDALAASGHDVLVHLAKTRSEGVVQLDRALRRGRSAGTLIVSTPFLSSLVERLGRAKQAVVLVDCEHPEFDSISVDNKRGGFLAVDHLLDAGCRKVALLMASRTSKPSSDRHTGYVEALASRGISVDEKLVAVCDGEQDGFTESAGFDAMQRLLARGARPDGVFATSDVQALGVLRALREAGLDVPGDVKVVGFDDLPLVRYADISTMRQPMYHLGSLGAARLLERLQNPGMPIENRVHAPELIARSTTVPVEEVIA